MLDHLGNLLLARRSFAYRWTFAVAAALFALLARHWLDGSLPEGFPFLTLFPAVVVTGFLAGVAPGVATAIICGIAAWYLFIPPFNSFALVGATALALSFYVFIVVTELLLIYVVKRVLRRLQTEKERSSALAGARELMFQELQHRVSNHLQIVSSLLKFQRRRVTDPEAQRALDEAAARLALVARIQRKLHDPSSQIVDLARFLREMSLDVVEAAGAAGRISVDVRAAPLAVDAAVAVPFGLIATELLSNAVEHGFGPKGSGRIDVDLSSMDEGRARLSVHDSGGGLTSDFDLETATGLGMTIARQFAEQLGGQLSISSARGTLAEFVFPLAGGASAA
jgi:two-component system, sensor histidine kinase PdtaS